MDKNMEGSFLALLFRMKHIHRWSLMYNTQIENLSEHTIECALLTHFLATIGNIYFNKDYNADKLASYALFHDVSEILTGDLPTPIKYYNSNIKNTYKEIELSASLKLLDHLPSELSEVYKPYLLTENGLSVDERKIIKVSDKLCAYIKCITEINAGNKEFSQAYKSIENEINNYECEELRYFLENCLESFSLSLDELRGTL